MGNLSEQARQQMARLHALTAQAYGGVVGQQFTATPTIAQTLNEKITEAGEPFLRMINTFGVKQVSGSKIYMGLSGTISGRTDTSGSSERVARRLVGLSDQPYTLKKVDSDAAIEYDKIDTWAEFPNFREMYQRLVNKAIADDRLRTGWHGTSAAATTNRTNNPLLQDLNVGWLQKLRDYNSGSQYLEGTVNAPIALGSAQYPGLDTLVHDAKAFIDIVFRGRNDLFALISDDLMEAEERAYYAANARKPTEKQIMIDGQTFMKYGGLPAMVPPFFPDGTILITPLKNLSVYWQTSSWRRQQIDNPKKDQYEDFNTRNEGYVVEEERAAALIEGITISSDIQPQE